MNHYAMRIYLLGVFVIALAGSCRRNSEEPAPGTHYRIVKAAETAYNLTVTMRYTYDGNERLALVREYPSVADTLDKTLPFAQTTVYYDADTADHIDHADRRLTKPVTDVDGLIYGTRRLFSYDDQGRLSTVTESNALDDFSRFKVVQTFRYEYGPDNLPTTLTVSGGPFLERDVYTYAFVNGNAVHIKLAVTNFRVTTPYVTEADIRFDDAPGVYYHFFAVYPGITSFNKNNVINANTTMVHDERGLLVERIKAGTYIDDVTQYTYERY